MLESSNTPYLTILLNGICPPFLRPVLLAFFSCLACCCCRCLPRSLRPALPRDLTPSYWQANLDDEITFYTFQFVALSVLPLFPSLLQATLGIMASQHWALDAQSCTTLLPPTYETTSRTCPFDLTARQGAGEGGDYMWVSHAFWQGNAQDPGTGRYYTNPLREEMTEGKCTLSEGIKGLATWPQVNIPGDYGKGPHGRQAGPSLGGKGKEERGGQVGRRSTRLRPLTWAKRMGFPCVLFVDRARRALPCHSRLWDPFWEPFPSPPPGPDWRPPHLPLLPRMGPLGAGTKSPGTQVHEDREPLASGLRAQHGDPARVPEPSRSATPTASRAAGVGPGSGYPKGMVGKTWAQMVE